MTKYLFLFTITPVQSFVAEARKAQDFFVGSNKLSSLTKCAIDEAQKNKEFKIIFPKKPEGKEEGKISYPNRFMAFVDSDNIKTFGDDLKAHVEKEFETWVDKSWESFEKPKNYEDQRDNYLSITWVAVEYDPEEDDYFKKYKEIESLLGGAKNIRDFKQLPDTEVGRKCSVCGERNALIFAEKKPWGAQEDSVLLEKKDRKYYLMNANEGLCAICAAKRFDKDANRYPSTSKIALLYTLDQYEKNGIPVEDSKCEYQYLLMSLKDENNARNFEGIDKDQKDDTDDILTQIRSCKNKDKIPCTAYYALVAFDGDSMGKTLGGGKLKDLNCLREFQEKLTQALGAFAVKVKKEGIADKEGRVVYAGGEDFFGFINLHYLFPVMTRLRQMFDSEVHNKLKDYLAEGEKLSFSAGITIAHVKTPLSVVIGKTREMEKKAKNRSSEKDAFAIAVMKHSGEINCIEMPWRNRDGRFYMDDMQDLIDSMTKGELSNTFYQVLQKEFMPIVGEKESIIERDNKMFREMLLCELTRTLPRALSKEGKSKTDEFCAKIEDLINACTTVDDAGNRLNIINFFHIFHVIDFIARETGGVNED